MKWQMAWLDTGSLDSGLSGRIRLSLCAMLPPEACSSFSRTRDVQERVSIHAASAVESLA